MKKRGQIVLFVIVGLVVVTGVFFIFLMKGRSKESLEGSAEQVVNLEAAKNSVDNFVTMCLKSNFNLAWKEYGPDPAKSGLYEDYIRRNIKECVNADFLEAGGLELQGADQDPLASDVSVKLNDDIAQVRLVWPIEISRGDLKTTVNEFTYSFATSLTVPLPIEGGNRISETIGFTTPDQDLTILLREGTVITGCDPTQPLTAKIKPQGEEEAKICEIRYSLTPEECEFSPPAEVHFTYPKNNPNAAAKMQEITLGVYDEEDAVWYVVPCYTDTKNEEVVCYFRHFGEVSCIEGNEAEIDPESVTEVSGKCELFAPVTDDCICGNNVIYYSDPADPLYCVPDKPAAIAEWIAEDPGRAKATLEDFGGEFGIDVTEVSNQLLGLYLIPDQQAREDTMLPYIDEFLRTKLDMDSVSYGKCAYEGRTYTKQELIDLYNTGYELTRLRLDTVPCICGDKIVHAPLREDDPFLCYVG